MADMLCGTLWARASDGFRNLYPAQGSVRMYCGLAGSSSIFLRSMRMQARRYSSSFPYSGPPTPCKSLEWATTAPLFLNK
jgi:hypothetical protein